MLESNSLKTEGVCETLVKNCTLLWQWMGWGPISPYRIRRYFWPLFCKITISRNSCFNFKSNLLQKIILQAVSVVKWNFTVICHYRMILCTIQAIVPWNTMPATLYKSIFKTRSHVLFGLGTISHSRSLLQYLFLLYYESLEEAGCRIVAEKLPSNDNPKKFCLKSEYSTHISI